MALNFYTLDDNVLNGDDFFLASEGSLIEIEQEVELEISGEGLICSIEQEVLNSSSGLIVSINQFVRNASIPDRISRNGFKPRITIDGYVIPDNQICGMHSITRNEGDASILTVMLQPPAGTIDLELYEGKPITYDIVRSNSTTRLFTGKINIPDVDLINKRIVLNCTDTREEQIAAQLGWLKNSIGYYSVQVQGEALGVADEVEKRMTTVCGSLDFNPYGNYTLTSWTAKASADFVFDDSDVYYRDPKVEFNYRHNIVNTINIDYQYRYPRLYHKVLNVDWAANYTVCQFLTNGYTMTQRTAVEAAARGAGWVLESPISYTPIFPSGWYQCSGSSTPILWSTVHTTGVTSGQTSNGSPVLDNQGQQVTTTTTTGSQNYGPLYCIGAGFELSKRFAQTITEQFSITVVAPQSVTKYGTIAEDSGAGIETNYDTGNWENYSEGTGTEVSFYGNVEPNVTDYIIGSYVVLNQAKKKILSTHRLTKVTFEIPGNEYLDLVHTVEIDTVPLQCKGKIRRIIHTIDAEDGEFSTEVELAISRASGSASPSAIVPPTRPTEVLPFGTTSVRLGNHFGVDPTTPAAANWNGMIGNKWLTTFTGGRVVYKKTTYPEAFIVDVPEIPAVYRDARTLPASQSYNIEIPNDPLVTVL